MSDEMVVASEVQETPAAPETHEAMVLVTSRLKQVVKGKGLRSAGTFVEALNAKVLDLIEQAAEHAKAEGRVTVKAVDLAA